MKSLKKVRIDSKVSLVYETINSSTENKPILVFLHEGLGSIAQWKDFPEKLCTTLNLPGLVYERYGYGHSTELQEKRKANYLHEEAEYYLPNLIKSLQLENKELVLIGHSDGASIALLYAALFPEKIVSVVSIAAHVFVEQMSVDSIKNLEKEFETNGNFRSRLENYHLDHTESTFYAFTRTIVESDFRQWNMEHFLEKIIAAILIIQGEEDEYGTNKQVNSIYTKVGSKKKEKWVIENCGHTPHLTHSKLVLQRVSKFLIQTIKVGE